MIFPQFHNHVKRYLLSDWKFFSPLLLLTYNPICATDISTYMAVHAILVCSSKDPSFLLNRIQFARALDLQSELIIILTLLKQQFYKGSWVSNKNCLEHKTGNHNQIKLVKILVTVAVLQFLIFASLLQNPILI